jgi:hypothetical protein
VLLAVAGAAELGRLVEVDEVPVRKRQLVDVVGAVAGVTPPIDFHVRKLDTIVELELPLLRVWRQALVVAA